MMAGDTHAEALEQAVAQGDLQAAFEAAHALKGSLANLALTCYAVEGAYPADLQYLRTQYRLAYDENRYMVFYEAWGENVMPDITVSEVGVSGV